jgi:hypothetical protein
MHSSLNAIFSSGSHRATPCAALLDSVSASRPQRPHRRWSLPSRTSARGAPPPAVNVSGCARPAFRPRKSPSEIQIGQMVFYPGLVQSSGRAEVTCLPSDQPPARDARGLFKWATKSTSLACENLMITAESLGLNTCPMEGFDSRRLARFLGLSSRDHEIVMSSPSGKSPQVTLISRSGGALGNLR